MILWQDDITGDDVGLVGTKVAALALVRRELGPGTAAGGDDPIITPEGFVITSDEATRPDGLEQAINDALQRLRGTAAEAPLLAVRSSAVAEDLAGRSFAGQYDSVLGVRTVQEVLDACRHVVASMSGERAVAYRGDAGPDLRMAVAVQRLVRADHGPGGLAGVMFTDQPDPDGIESERVTVIEAVRGLGDTLVSGAADPDRFVRTTAGAVRAHSASAGEPLLTDRTILRLARWGDRLRGLFGGAVDVEWAVDGISGELVVVQVRPLADPAPRITDTAEGGDQGPAQQRALATGLAVGRGTAIGTVRVVDDPRADHEFVDGDVLVAGTTDPGWLPLMQRAAAIVTDHGGRTSHAAIVCRELGLLAVVGCGNATEVLRAGLDVRITCESNGRGVVYGD